MQPQLGGTRVANYASTYAGLPTTSRVPGLRSAMKGVGAVGGFIAKRPKTSMGIGAAGVGYMGYRNAKGSQNSPIIGVE